MQLYLEEKCPLQQYSQKLTNQNTPPKKPVKPPDLNLKENFLKIVDDLVKDRKANLVFQV